MVALLREFPRIRVTFNLVPSLVAQVQAFADDRARDRHLALGLKPAADLTPEEARWMVANGFHAPYRADDRPLPALRRAARLPDGTPRRSVKRTCAICRCGTSWRGWIPICWSPTRVSSRSCGKDRDYGEARQGDAADDRARAAVARGARVPRRRRRADRWSSRPRRSITRSCRCCAIRMSTSMRIPMRRGRGVRFARPEDARLQIDRAIAFSRGDLRTPAARHVALGRLGVRSGACS